MRPGSSGALCVILGLGPWNGVAGATTLASTANAVSGSLAADGSVPSVHDPIGAGDTIAVPAGARLTPCMAGNSTLSIAPDSGLAVRSHQPGGDDRRPQPLLMHGFSRAAIVPAGSVSSFVIATALGTASVRFVDAGWYIEARPSLAQAGAVDLMKHATGRVAPVHARWGSRIEAGHDPAMPGPWSRAEHEQRRQLTE